LKFSEYFDIRNPAHLDAFKYFSVNGKWQEGFIPPYVTLDLFCYFKIMLRMAEAWLSFKLFGEE
jgi:hypothetical protein